MKKQEKNVMKKSAALYIVMLIIWTILAVVLWYNFALSLKNVPFKNGITNPGTARKICATVLLALNGIFISYFWLNGVKDFIYVVWYYVNRSRLVKRHKELFDTNVTDENAKVLLIYCTCNDFDGKSLLKSIERQTWKNTETVILDDSNDDKYKKSILFTGQLLSYNKPLCIDFFIFLWYNILVLN